MTQLQFQMIVKIISNGAPAVAEELCTELANVCNENEQLKKDLEAANASLNESEPEKAKD